MAIGNIPGILLLLAATVLLVLASITAPVSDNFYFLKAVFEGVSLGGASAGRAKLILGMWGACVNSSEGESCTPRQLGYGLNLSILNLNDDTQLAQALLRGVSKALVLVPVSAAVSFLAFLFALSTNVVMDVLASVISLLAAFVTLIAFIICSVVFATARHRLNDLDGVHAELSNAYWMVLAAFLCQLLASCFVLFGCFKRRRSRRSPTYADTNGHAPMAEKRHWWARNQNGSAAV